MNVTKGLLFLIGLNLIACRHDAVRVPAEEAGDRTLKVALDLDMPGYFLFNGKPFGYQYEILKEFARSEGKELEIVSDFTNSSYPELFAEGSLDLAVTLHPEYFSFIGNQQVVSVYDTRYVVLARKRPAGGSDKNSFYSRLSGRKVMVPQGFVQTESFNVLMDSVPDAQIFLTSRNVFEGLELLSSGKCDFVVCESMESVVGCTLIKNIRTVYEFPESIPVSVVINSTAAHARSFPGWLAEFTRSARYAKLSEFYHGPSPGDHFVTESHSARPKGATSVYDELFRRICSEEKVDWRFVSAIAYHESRYNSFLVSPKGATGLMQVMPSVARQFGVPQEELMNPEENVRLAVRLLRRIESSLRLAPDTSFDDRMQLILACYNGGIGHVQDARSLARKYGGNPDSWEDVSRYLRLKSAEEYFTDEVVKCGRFAGSSSTCAFVSNVMGRYRNYCALAAL